MYPSNWEDTIEVILGGSKTVNTIDKIGDFVGLYLKSGVLNDTVPFKIIGRVIGAPKATGTGDVWTPGARLYWNVANSNFTQISDGSAPVAVAAAAALNAATVGDVILLGGPTGVGGEPVAISIDINANTVAKQVFVADRAYQVVSAREIHSVIGGAVAAMRPRKITDTSAPGAVASATVKELTTENFDCTAAINTTQVGTLSATLSDLQLAAGDKIAINPSGTLTGLVGNITIVLRPI